MAQTPTGSTFHIATTIAAAQTTTVVSNATEAVVTCAAHGYSNDDIVIVYSGWGRLNKRAARIKSVATNTFVLEGIDTSSTSYFPAGTGIGSVQKITAFTQITQIVDVQSSGGDPKTVQYQYIESDVENSINNGFTATNYTLEIDAGSIGTSGYTALRSLTDVQTDTVLRINLRDGSMIYQPCTVALNEAVKMQRDQIMTVGAALNGNNRNTRYSS